MNSSPYVQLSVEDGEEKIRTFKNLTTMCIYNTEKTIYKTKQNSVSNKIQEVLIYQQDHSC